MMDIDKAREVYGMHKQANPIAAIAAGGKALFDLGHFGGPMLLALAAGAGISGGWTVAQLTAHTKASADTAKKEYMRQRLNADIATLSGKIGQEADAIEPQEAKKPARVLGN